MRIPTVLHRDAVTIIQRSGTGTTTKSGVPIKTEAPGIPWSCVNVQQTGTTETTRAGRTVTVTTFRVSGPPPTVAIDEGDTIRWQGLDCQVVGSPDVRAGRNRINHTSLTMQHTAG